jgi:5-methylcytosine-specific restriction endonuclease McrA
MATDYQDKLRDVEWQKRRLEVMQRDHWACTRCGKSTGEMHVHHNRYRRGRMPWESPSDELTTLCKGCHDVEHGITRIGETAASRTAMVVPTEEDYRLADERKAELKRILGVS